MVVLILVYLSCQPVLLTRANDQSQPLRPPPELWNGTSFLQVSLHRWIKPSSWWWPGFWEEFYIQIYQVPSSNNSLYSQLNFMSLLVSFYFPEDNDVDLVKQIPHIHANTCSCTCSDFLPNDWLWTLNACSQAYSGRPLINCTLFLYFLGSIFLTCSITPHTLCKA